MSAGIRSSGKWENPNPNVTTAKESQENVPTGIRWNFSSMRYRNKNQRQKISSTNGTTSTRRTKRRMTVVQYADWPAKSSGSKPFVRGPQPKNCWGAIQQTKTSKLIANVKTILFGP